MSSWMICGKCGRGLRDNETIAGWKIQMGVVGPIVIECPECQGIEVTPEMEEKWRREDQQRRDEIQKALDEEARRREVIKKHLDENGPLPPLVFTFARHTHLSVEVAIEDLYFRRFKALDEAKDKLVQLALDNNLSEDETEIIVTSEWVKDLPEGVNEPEGTKKDSATLRSVQSQDGLTRIATSMANPIKFRIQQKAREEEADCKQQKGEG